MIDTFRVKNLLATLGVSMLVLVVGIGLCAFACVVAVIAAVWWWAPSPTSARADAPSPAVAEAPFDGPAWALETWRARQRGVRPPAGSPSWLHAAASEFDREGAARVERATATWLCRVTLERVAWDQTVGVVHADGGTSDLFEGIVAPDIAAVFAVAGAPPRFAFGPEDRHEATLAFPMATVAPGVAVTLTPRDRDVAVDDGAGTSTVRHDGHFPVRFAGQRFTAECRGLAPERALEVASPDLAALDALTTRFELPDHSGDSELWQAKPRMEAAQRALIHLADWLGWSHPEVVRRVAQVDAMPERLPGQVRAALGTVRLSRETTLSWGQRIRITRWVCGAAATGLCGVTDARGCVAEYTLSRFDGDEPPMDRTRVALASEEVVVHAAVLTPLERARTYCMRFDTGAARELVAGRTPAVLMVAGASDPMRLQ